MMGKKPNRLPVLYDRGPLDHFRLNEVPKPFALAQRVICVQPVGQINTTYAMIALMSSVMQHLIKTVHEA
jgi:hypothetical protein